jgi:hypothetical protein
MAKHIRRWALPVTAVAALFAAAAPASAGVFHDPVPIGPRQAFNGVVNGQSATATVRVDCVDGQSGHPAAGQTISVTQTPGADKLTGFTGSTARTIALGAADPGTVPVQLRVYDRPTALPVSLSVPCGGGGLFSFVPAPGSPTAVPATVKVVFVPAS